ncbi:DNA ligase 4 isoform 2-T4 [Menidia menidia]
MEAAASESGPTVAAQVPFLHLCNTLEKIQKAKLRPEKSKILGDFIESWRKFHSALHKDDPHTSDSFYPAMRLIVPAFERERMAYGIKESMLAKLYIEVLGLPRNGPEALRLLNYRAPASSQGEAGDFAGVAYFVLRKRCSGQSSLSVAEVNGFLDSVAVNNAGRQKDQVRRSLLHLLTRSSALEQKWLIRMILKDMKLGVSRDSVLQAFHPDACELFNVSTDLRRVCGQLHRRDVSLGEVSVQLFSAFKPMLAAVADLRGVQRLLEAGEELYVQTKLDGERIQMHKDGDVYRYFSRNGFEYTQQFGGSPLEGALTPHIHAQIRAASCILDGEMMAFSPTAGVFMQKGAHFDIKRLRPAEDSDLQACFCAFDLLLLDGEKLGGAPLSRRLELLAGAVLPLAGRLTLVASGRAGSLREVVDALNAAIDAREEGVMLKEPRSLYRPDRRGEGWIKVKPEYVDGLMDELDLLIVGGYWGTGRRGGMMSHFLLAVAEDGEEAAPTSFRSLCRVGSGYSMKELWELGLKLAPHWRVAKKGEPPPAAIRCATERPEVYIEPCKSVIVQVKAAEIVSSDVYGAGCTLRFPRIERIREDKRWHQCMTQRQLEELRGRAAGKLASRHLQVDGGQPQKKKRRLPVRPKKEVGLVQHFRAQDLSGVSRETDMFQDVEFCILNGTEEHPKAELERGVARCGGLLVQNPGPDTYCVVAGVENLRVRNLVCADRHDVVRASWLLECLAAAGEPLPWQPRHMIHASPPTRAHFAREYDAFGDSYFRDTDPGQLGEVFARMGATATARAAPVAVDAAAVERRYGWDDLATSMFRPFTAYVDGAHLGVAALEFRFHGGRLATEAEEGVSHVVVGGDGRLEELRALRRSFRRKFRIVGEKWVRDSITAGHLRDDRQYLL